MLANHHHMHIKFWMFSQQAGTNCVAPTMYPAHVWAVHACVLMFSARLMLTTFPSICIAPCTWLGSWVCMHGQWWMLCCIMLCWSLFWCLCGGMRSTSNIQRLTSGTTMLGHSSSLVISYWQCKGGVVDASSMPCWQLGCLLWICIIRQGHSHIHKISYTDLLGTLNFYDTQSRYTKFLHDHTRLSLIWYTMYDIL